MSYCFWCMAEIDDPNEKFCPECGQVHNVFYSQSNELPPGTYLHNGRYFVGRTLGSGGFGITYLGFDVKLCKKVVIKETYYSGLFKRNNNDKTVEKPLSVTYDDSISIDKIMEKTSKECRSISKAEGLNNIVKVYEWFLENNTAYIITEYINGKTLYDKIHEQGHLTWKEFYPKMKPLIENLATLHENGLLHRDVKPQNIMIRHPYKHKEDFVLIDFGLARSTEANTIASRGIAFTPGYAPYEQRTFTHPDGTYTDVYSMAATIYHALTGFAPKDDFGKTLYDNFPYLQKLRESSDVPENVVDALEYALQPSFHDRCQTLDEFLSILENTSDNSYKSKLSSGSAYSAPDTLPSYESFGNPAPNSFAPSSGNYAQSREYYYSGNNSRAADMTFQPENYNSGYPQNAVPAQVSGSSSNKALIPVIALVTAIILSLAGFLIYLVLDGNSNDKSNSESSQSEESASVSTEVTDELTVTVPNVQGLTLSSAQQILESAGLKYKSIEQPNNNYSVNTVIRQYPAANENISKGSEVWLYYAVSDSNGQTISVAPTESGVNSGSAASSDKDKNTDSASSSASSSQKASDNDKNNSSSSASSQSNNVAVPNVVGMTYEKAVEKLTSVGLIADIKEYQFSSTVADGCVISQSPASGNVAKNSKVILTISKGEDPNNITVGNYFGKNIFSTKDELEGKGLHVVYSFSDSGYPQGAIIAQSVQQGAVISRGSTITFTVAETPYTRSTSAIFRAINRSSEAGGFPSGNILYYNGEAWAPTGGVGEYIEFTAPTPQNCSGFVIDIGYNKNNETFMEYGRPSTLLVECSDGSQFTFNLDPECMTHQECTFGKTVSTTYMKFTIKAVTPGTSSSTPCISTIVPY